uniref:Putative secreted protein n=1 Tax=Ixodes ricinus TaxID=34613 RepID=A0A6B0UCW2_IXORI
MPATKLWGAWAGLALARPPVLLVAQELYLTQPSPATASDRKRRPRSLLHLWGGGLAWARPPHIPDLRLVPWDHDAGERPCGAQIAAHCSRQVELCFFMYGVLL